MEEINKEHLLTTTGHTQLPGRGVANVGSFGYLSVNTTRLRSVAATAYTGGRQPVQKLRYIVHKAKAKE